MSNTQSKKVKAIRVRINGQILFQRVAKTRPFDVDVEIVEA